MAATMGGASAMNYFYPHPGPIPQGPPTPGPLPKPPIVEDPEE
jgi:hypothetical protein